MPQLIRNARAYLLSFGGVTSEQLDAHLKRWQQLRQDSLEGIYYSFLSHAKNRQGMPNTIGDPARLSAIFFGFNPKQVVNHYQTHEEILQQILAQRVRTSGQIDPSNNRSHWVIYVKSALSSARFLSRFETAQDFHDFVQSFYVNEYSRLALPLLIKEEIFGFGFALACDFLKESGYSGFVKPDTHINDICRAAGITAAETDFGVFKDVIAYCTEHHVVPYEFDQLIWLVGSGKMPIRELPTNKLTFIADWLRREG